MLKFKKERFKTHTLGKSILAFLFGTAVVLSQNQKKVFSVQLAESVMYNNAAAWMTDFNPKPVWGYVQGLVCLSLQEVSKEKNDPKYFDYVKNTYVDLLINEKGTIEGYQPETFKLDDINSGKILFSLYEKTKDERYRIAIEKLHEQLKKQPRITEGAFWHKKVYPNQVWLDGLYMGLPFYAQYAVTFGDAQAFDDITSQLLTVQKHLKDPKTGLYYHGWDASKTVYWADPKTGLSQNFWGRGVGWLYMALIDVLEYLPANHKDRKAIELMFQNLTDDLVKVQDPATGVWFQVLNYPKRDGNYREATGSAMFVYGLAKGLQLKVLDKKHFKTLKKAYSGFQKEFIKIDGNKQIEITSCCAGAGLGPADNLVRNGTYDYYIHEAVRSNDGKAIGPFIMACLILEKHPQWTIL
ncbi:glycoside hydrolase family 88/105 protein [Flavobacterium anhuiense]|uniref:glycoside hydrolase family 88/105 protein n=1 Tax=Flavobacterium anhuiense TaxID=459526 RepID=UPI003D96AA08